MSYYCPRCNETFDEARTKSIPAGSGTLRVCVTCGGALRRETSAVASRATKPLSAEMLLAYAFPFRPSSLALLVPVAVVTAIFARLSVVTLAWGLLTTVAAYGIEFGTMFAIVRATAAGEDEVSIDSSMLDIGAAGAIVLRYVLLALMCVLPALALAWVGASGAVIALAALAGYLYFPAGLIAAAQEEATLADAVLGYRIIAAFPGPYFLAVACMTPAAAAWFLSPLVTMLVPEADVVTGWLLSLASQLVSVFAFAIVARIAGILLRDEVG